MLQVSLKTCMTSRYPHVWSAVRFSHQIIFHSQEQMTYSFTKCPFQHSHGCLPEEESVDKVWSKQRKSLAPKIVKRFNLINTLESNITDFLSELTNEKSKTGLVTLITKVCKSGKTKNTQTQSPFDDP